MRKAEAYLNYAEAVLRCGNTGYQWEGKSGVKNGANFPQYMNLYPIPTRLLQAMYQGVQNPGY